MKFYRRSCCVLLCCLLLSGVFSVAANAEELSLSDYKVEMWVSNVMPNGQTVSGTSFTFYPNDGTQQKSQKNVNFSDYVASSGTYTIENTVYYKFSMLSGSPLIDSSEMSANFTLTNAYYSLGVQSTQFVYYRVPNFVRAVVTYIDGSAQYFDDADFFVDGYNLTIILDFVPTADVLSLEFQVMQEVECYCRIPEGYITTYFGEQASDNSYSITIDQPTKTEGFLSGIFEKTKEVISNLKDGFTDTVNNLKNGFNNVVETLTGLPEKIWEKISQGILDLFVPDEDYLIEYKDRMDEFLAEKFGAIYQVVQVTFESWERITDADEQNIIEFPETTIQITNNTCFSFGPYEVPIVPSGFEWLITILKSVCGIVCTILFVNGLRKRYDEVMGVEK